MGDADQQAVLAALLSLDRVSPKAEGFSYQRIALVAGLPPHNARTFHTVSELREAGFVEASSPPDTHALWQMRFRLTNNGWWRASHERTLARARQRTTGLDS